MNSGRKKHVGGSAKKKAGTKKPGMFERIHKVVAKIPKGKVASYGEVAKAAGFPGAARQVVWALRAGRGLPWHRVVGADGKIMLPDHHGLEQRMRLEMEGVAFRGARVDMAASGWRKSR